MITYSRLQNGDGITIGCATDRPIGTRNSSRRISPGVIREVCLPAVPHGHVCAALPPLNAKE